MTQHFVLLEGNAEWDGGPAVLVHWDRSDVPLGRLSLPQLVDRNWQNLRRDYIGWIHECGESPLNGGTLRSAMQLGERELSAWWITLMAEKSPMKTRTAYTVLKLRTFEILCDSEEADEITYLGSDKSVDRVLKRWCSETGRHYFSRNLRAKSARDGLGRRVKFLPHPLRGLAWLGWRWWTRVRPVRGRVAQGPQRQPDCAVVTYFPNCDTNALTNGKFRSNYWQDAHDLFDALPAGVDWIWMYSPSSAVSLSDALNARDRCNAPGSKHSFRLMEEFVSPGVMLQALWHFIALWARSGPIMRACGSVSLPGARMNLAPVLSEDWAASVRGIVAAEAAYCSAAFEAMAAGMPTLDKGLYVFENQPWEIALVKAWKDGGVETVIGHQHEAIKPLNLRLFDDRRTLAGAGTAPKPLPDVLAVGSASARDAFFEVGWPSARVRLVESLRFRAGAPVSRPISDRPYLLLVTGYLEPETRNMIEMAANADAAGALSNYAGIRIKPHPFLPVDDMVGALHFKSRVEIMRDPLPDLWPETGFAFMANSTAAVLDALAAGIPSAVCAPADDLNLSPALGMDVAMIASADALAIILQERPTPARPPDFCYEEILPRWAALLGVDTAKLPAAKRTAKTDARTEKVE